MSPIREAGTRDAERADAEQDGPLFPLDPLINPLDEPVDARASPVTAVELPPGRLVLPPARVVREGELSFLPWRVGGEDRIRVEVIVEMDAVDVVAPEDVKDDLQGALRGLRLARIEPEHLAVALHEIGARLADVIGRFLEPRVEAGAVRVEPGVQLEPAPVGLVDPEAERVVVGFGPISLRAGEVRRPGLEARLVEGVGGGADLEDDRVEPDPGGGVEDADRLALLLGGESPGRVGQSMFATVATQAARNSRGNGGGSSAAEERPTVDPTIAAAAKTTVRAVLDIQAIRMILSRCSTLALGGGDSVPALGAAWNSSGVIDLIFRFFIRTSPPFSGTSLR